MDSLGIDVKLLVAQLLNFALFYYVFKRYIAKPFSNFFNLEVEKEKEKERLLEKIKIQEEETIAKEKLMLQKIKQEESEVLKKARSDGENNKKEIIASAKHEAEEIIERTRRQIGDEKKQMTVDLKEQALKMALKIVEKGLNQFLTPEAQRQVTQNILKNYSGEKK
ncbi:hypothetical protein A2774_04220 [Candidatus Roizmanbacteria bacterium RIFCSPHIGHO2_01_FULL_39_12c]|uniref:ATP synthase subunit b n=1 Tax=Candidatus Roizmanbacteria bacterium RIFCSPHIGHO2_01_FULL_39_12c TaxID=1802031 RepID=A0A1F7GER6_9BACT|nr:MAG: hypothetical protein A2774_04220 [Candidatus Roizmanbacteria bacterium RIFCSPHIGHO2_01_FULL_39_12c]OGK48098.1 MAG: hypothetical protein A2963_04035 [Candidatus Roizmanbacteria bacterium RIFCSPLOWO2_01_FULL_40_13]